MQPKVRRVYLPKVKIAFLLFGAFLLLIVFLKAILVSQSVMNVTGITPGTVLRLVFDSGADLKPINGRVNMALLGIAGGEHEGADLTDTILVLSFELKAHKLAMISMPRDIWSDTLKDKINSAYHYGEAKKKGGGLILAKAVLADVVGLPIQHSLVLDFSAFKDIIDLVGGITINVPKAFTDTEFPIAGRENDMCGGDPTLRCRYETLHFDAGEQRMDGDRALKYVRSRHAEGDEGSDFARGKRQQEMLLALKQRITSRDILLSSKTLEKLYVAFDKATDTDMNIGQLLTLGKLFVNIREQDVKKVSLEDELYTPPSSWYGRFVLLPKEGFEALHEFITASLK